MLLFKKPTVSSSNPQSEVLDKEKEIQLIENRASSAPSTYEDYFREFLPKMGDSRRAYNNFQRTDKEILAILFPGLPHGTYPDQETATKKFAELARNGRPYAKLFNPPSDL